MASRVDQAIERAKQAIAFPVDSPFGLRSSVRTDDLRLLVRWIETVRPVPTDHVDDFNVWQDHIDAALSRDEE